LDLGRADQITAHLFPQALIWPIHATDYPGNVCLQIGSFLSWNFFAHPSPHTLMALGGTWLTKGRSAPPLASQIIVCFSICVRACFVRAARKKSTTYGYSHHEKRVLCSQNNSTLFLEQPTVNQ
jgi:hypothetical protein